MPRRLGNGAAATLGGEGRDCDHAAGALRGFGGGESADGSLRRDADVCGERGSDGPDLAAI